MERTPFIPRIARNPAPPVSLGDPSPASAGDSMDRVRPVPNRPPARAATIALLALAIALPVLALADVKPGDPVKGKQVFLKNCMVCHNADGSGGKKLTPNGNPSRDFRDEKFWASRADAQVRATINAGVAKSGMIAWKGILKPQEIEDAMSYIKLFAKKSDASKADAPKADAPKAEAASPDKK